MIWNNSVELDDVCTLQLLIAIGKQRASDATFTKAVATTKIKQF